MSIDRVFRFIKQDKPEKEFENTVRWGQSLLKEGLEVKRMTGPYINADDDQVVYIAHFWPKLKIQVFYTLIKKGEHIWILEWATW